MPLRLFAAFPQFRFPSEEMNNTSLCYVSPGMKSILLNSLESLLSVKRQRLSLARSLRSRIVLKREILQLQQQIDDLRAKPL